MSSTSIEIEQDETEDGVRSFEVTTETWRGRDRTRRVRTVSTLDDVIALVVKAYGGKP